MYQMQQWLVATLIVCMLPSGLSGTTAAQDQEAQLAYALIDLIQDASALTPLELKKTIERKLEGVERHEYQVTLEKGQFIHLVVEQRGVDVVVLLYAPDGKKIIEVDSPNGTQGPEPVLAIAEEAGKYRVEVAKLDKDAAAGNYAIRLEELRVATAEDRQQAAILADLAQAVFLTTQADELYGKGKYAEAEPLYQRALVIREKVRGGEYPYVANSLNSLAMLYQTQGDYARALPLYQRALAIMEKALGEEHPDLAGLFNNLATLYQAQGDYARALPLYQRALAIDEKALGGEHLTVATDLNNLATLYQILGDYARALFLHQRALAIDEKALGGEHLTVAADLNNLAAVYHKRGDHARELLLYQRALAIREKVLGGEHPLVAQSLNHLAVMYYERGNYARALPLYQRALAIDEKALGSEHYNVASDLNNLAMLYQAQGDYARALPLYQRSLAILEKALGGEHPDVALSLNNLALLYAAQGDYGRAISFEQRAAEARERNIAAVLDTGSQQQKQLYLNALSYETDDIVSLQMRAAPPNGDAARLALMTILRRKGRALDAFTGQLTALRQRATPADRALLEQLAAARTQSATLILKGQGNNPEVKQLEAEAERLEDIISRSSTEFRAITQPVTLEGVIATIPPDAALVELMIYRPFYFRAIGTKTKSGAARYVACVLRRADDVPRFVDLGKATVIDADVERLRAALKDPKRTDVKPVARALDKRVMRPIRKLLGSTQRLFLSPDGALNLIPFGALVDENGRYLVEKYSITYLTSGRDLLRLQVQTESRSSPMVMADPLYDLTASRPGLSSVQANRTPDQTNENRRSTDFTLKTYIPLPGTAEEAAALAKLLPQGTQVLLQEQATEAALKQVNSPRILHIATHGFFLSDQTQGSSAGNTPRRGTVDTLDTSPPPAHWENPLLRSGLVLAGVKQGQSGPSEDGVLTALEAAGLDLWGTKLVVLSACETGLGDVQNGAGVYGLRRALVLAGSETQVMSLWKVSDAGTRDLMTAYYTRLQKGAGRTETLRQVQLEMLRRELLPSVSSGKRETGDTDVKAAPKDYRHPYYWAAFIPSGDWRSMDGK